MIKGVGDVQIPLVIDRDSERVIQATVLRRAAIAPELSHAVPGHSSDDLSRAVPFPDEMAVGIGDQDMPLRIQGTAIVTRQTRRKLVRPSLVPVLPALSCPGADVARLMTHHQNPAVKGVRA